MTYGSHPYGGVGYAGSDVAEIPSADTQTALSVEVAFTTGALETPVWEDITADVRFWDVQRGRSRELERHQPGRATVVLGNLSRQYDSVYADGPHFGDLRPMRRIRIRETFNGVTYPVFDGFVDRWELDYPAVGKDATATVTATDMFKILARTELPRSVYADEVGADAPDLWWHLDDPQALFAAVDASGNDHTGTPKGNVRFGAETLVVNDPGSSVGLDEAQDTNVEASLTVDGASTFAFEFWFKFEEAPTATSLLAHLTSGGSAQCNFQINNSTLKGGFVFQNNAGGAFSAQPNFVFVVGQRYHIVCTHKADRVLRVFINGAEEAYDVQDTTTGVTGFTLAAVGSSDASTACRALVDEFAVYTTVPSDARIATHYEAGTTPWQDDQPDDRLERILDEAEWFEDLRELDSGNVALQSAELGTTALEHAQKVAETEYGGLLFVNRAGVVRFVSRETAFGRQPYPVTFGDGSGEVGYRAIRPDDGDEVIRNSATISRLNGVAQTATGTTIDEFGRFQYTLEGLLHRLDSYSVEYANFVVNEYDQPRRRITELTVGPVPDGDEDLYYPAMLGPELGDAIDVTHTPQALGDPFEQTCVIEGIRHTSAPGRNRQVTFTLSPEYSFNASVLGADAVWEDYAPSNTNVTVGNGTQVARFARIGNTIHWNYKLLFGSTTAFTGSVSIGLPVNGSSSMPAEVALGAAQMVEAGVAFRLGVVSTDASPATDVRILHDEEGSNTGVVNATAPFTWGTGDILAISGTYETA